MNILVNKTARVINVDSLTLIPGVAQKVGDLQSLLSVYLGLKAMVEAGEIIVKKAEETKAMPDVAQEAEAGDKTKRRTARKKE